MKRKLKPKKNKIKKLQQGRKLLEEKIVAINITLQNWQHMNDEMAKLYKIAQINKPLEQIHHEAERKCEETLTLWQTSGAKHGSREDFYQSIAENKKIMQITAIDEKNNRLEGIDAKTGEFFAVTFPITREQWRDYQFGYFSDLFLDQREMKIDHQVMNNKKMLSKLIEEFKNVKKLGQKLFLYFSNLHKNLFKDKSPQSVEYLASALILCEKPRDRYYEDVKNYEKLVEDFHNHELNYIKPEIIAELNTQIKNITDEPSPPKDEDNYQYSYSPSPGW